MDDRAKQAREIFMEISELAPADRDQALDRACGGDADLRARIEALLRASRDAEGFMGQPTAEVMDRTTLNQDHSKKSGSGSISAAMESVGQQIGRY